MTLPLQFVVTPIKTEHLLPYLERARERVLLAQTPRERFCWLAIQAALEGRINQAQQQNCDIIATTPQD